MKICDRCHGSDGSSVIACEEIVFVRDDSRMDLCKSCMEDIRGYCARKSIPEHDVLGETLDEPKKRGRKPKMKE